MPELAQTVKVLEEKFNEHLVVCAEGNAALISRMDAMQLVHTNQQKLLKSIARGISVLFLTLLAGAVNFGIQAWVADKANKAAVASRTSIVADAKAANSSADASRDNQDTVNQQILSELRRIHPTGK